MLKCTLYYSVIFPKFIIKTKIQFDDIIIYKIEYLIKISIDETI